MTWLKTSLFKKLLLQENRHWFMLLYWILFGVLFWTMEAMPHRNYHTVGSVLDGYIPFCRWFVIPYFFWFVFIVGSMAYFIFKDKTAFVKYMWFVIISYSITLLIYAVYPTQQNLRPRELQGDGVLISIIRWLYGFDTNTNVCPSLHVIGSFSVCFAAFRCEHFRHPLIRTAFAAATALICAATVFIKQHSVVDVFWGVVVSAAVYPFVFAKNRISAALTGIFCTASGTKELLTHKNSCDKIKMI